MDGIGYLGIFVLLLGGACVAWGWSGHKAARAMRDAAQNWPTTAGAVTAVEVRLNGRGPKSSYWVPVVSYAYAVDGGQHVDDRLRFGFVGTQGRGAAERMIARYAVGSPVAVRYDPANPAVSVLEPDRLTSNLLITAIAGVVLTLLGLAIVLAAAQGLLR